MRRTAMNLIAICLAAIGGVSAAAQTGLMGRFGERIGTLPAVTFTAVGSTVSSLLLLTLVGPGAVAVVAGAHAPAWMWTTGVIGAVYFFSLTVAVPRIGTTATIGFLIAGQLTIGFISDQFGILGVDRIPLSWPRVMGVLFVAAGAMLALRR